MTATDSSSSTQWPILSALLVIALTVGATGTLAQASPDAVPQGADAPHVASEPFAAPDDPEAIHDELRALRSTMETALNERDLDTLVANVDPDVVFTTMNGDVARGRDEVRKYYEQMMVGPDKVVESVETHFKSDALSILYGDSLAIAYGPTEDHYVLADGSAFDIEARWSATLIRRQGRWLVASFHYSTNMFDNPVLRTTRTMLIRFLIGGVLVAGLLGFFLGRRRRSTAG